MPVKTITAEIDGVRREIKADIPDDATPEEVEGAVHQYVSANPFPVEKQQEQQPEGVFSRALKNLPQSLMNAVRNAPMMPQGAANKYDPSTPFGEDPNVEATTLRGGTKPSGAEKFIISQSPKQTGVMDSIRGLAESFNPATAPERFAQDPVGTVLVPASVVTGGLRAMPEGAASRVRAAASAGSKDVAVGSLKLGTGALIAKTGPLGEVADIISGYPLIHGGVKQVGTGIKKAYNAARDVPSGGAARAVRVANIEKQVNWKPPAPPPESAPSATPAPAATAPLAETAIANARRSTIKSLGYGNTPYENLPPGHQQAVDKITEQLVPKTSTTAPRPTQQTGRPIFDKQAGEAVDFVNRTRLDKEEFMVNYLRSKGINRESFAKAPMEAKNALIDEINAYRRTISNPTEVAAEPSLKAGKLSQYKKYKADKDSMESIERTLESPLWNAPLQWRPVPPPPVR